MWIMQVVVVICYKFICKLASFYDMMCHVSSYASFMQVYMQDHMQVSLFL